MMPDGGHAAGRGHHHGDVPLLQPGQNLVQAGLFGRRGQKGRLTLLVQGLDDAVGVAVRPIEPAQHRPHGVACGAAGGFVQPLLIRKAQPGQCGFPQGGQMRSVSNIRPSISKMTPWIIKQNSFPGQKTRFVPLLYHFFSSLHIHLLIIWRNLPGPKMKDFAIPCKSWSSYYNRKQHSAFRAQELCSARDQERGKFIMLDIKITRNHFSQGEAGREQPGFGKKFTDHMFVMDYTEGEAGTMPHRPLRPL